MVMVTFSWDGGSVDTLVIKPDGTPLDVNGQSQDVFVVTSANMVNYNIMSPDAGVWQFALQNAHPNNQGSINYVFSVSYPQEK